MRRLRLLFVAATGMFIASSTATAQDGVHPAPHGTYIIAADSGYAGPDISGFKVEFGADSTFVVSSPDGSLIVKSKVTYAEGIITLNDVDGQNVCPAAGKYRVGGDDKVLKLKSVEDGCPDRAAIIDGIKFVRQSS